MPSLCRAIQYSDQVVCKRCDLVWDVNDPDPPPYSDEILEPNDDLDMWPDNPLEGVEMCHD